MHLFETWKTKSIQLINFENRFILVFLFLFLCLHEKEKEKKNLVLMITSASTPSSCVLVFDVDIFFLDTALGSGNSQKRRSPTCLKSQKLHFFVRKNKRPIDNPQPKTKSQFWNYEIPVNHKPRSRRSFFQCFFFDRKFLPMLESQKAAPQSFQI